MVFKNRDVQLFNIRNLFTKHFVGNYIPITMFFHAFAYKLFGNWAGGHHLLNIILHLFNGILIHSVIQTLFTNKKLSLFITCVFLLHPLQVESVAWISELKNVLSASFALLSFKYYLSYQNTQRMFKLIISFLFFALGCFSKSSVIILPLIFLITVWFLQQKIILQQVKLLLPFTLLSIIVGLVNINTQAADRFINFAHNFPVYEKIGFAGYAILVYCLNFLFPLKLSVLYPYPENKLFAISLGYLFLLLVILFIFYFLKKKSYNPVLLILLLFVNLILVLQFIPFGEVLNADRYMYLAIISFALPIGILLWRKMPMLNYLNYFITVVLATLTVFRVSVWSSSISLYSDILKKYPNSFVALNSLGAEYMMNNKNELAEKCLTKATEVSPKNYKGFYNKGLLYLKTNQAQLAIENLNTALTIYSYAKAYVARSSAYLITNDFSKAMNDAKTALELDENSSKAHFVMAECLNHINDLDGAMKEYNRAISIDGDVAEYYFKRSIAFGKQQNFMACLSDLNATLSYNPKLYEAYYWRGVAKFNLKQNPCSDFKKAGESGIEMAYNALSKYCK
ncbi:MAG: hypothetical protein JSU07_04410 [Bacteroidetes bacterium]|nr:hypothetical protein [Bacteroidota bacterium]